MRPPASRKERRLDVGGSCPGAPRASPTTGEDALPGRGRGEGEMRSPGWTLTEPSRPAADVPVHSRAAARCSLKNNNEDGNAEIKVDVGGAPELTDGARAVDSRAREG